MQLIAMRWLIYRLTKSELMVGMVGFISEAPLFLLVPFAGVWADRLKRHRIMVVTQALSALQAALLALLVLTDQVAVWHVLILGGLLGVVMPSILPRAKPSLSISWRKERTFPMPSH